VAECSIGYAVTEVVREAITLLPEWAWIIADNHDGNGRESAHPAAQMDAFEEREGWRSGG
jgi:hypothetical protein